MNKLKVVTVVGTRPEIIRLCRVIAALEKSVEHTLIHTGQNYDYELSEVFFKNFELREPDYYLNAAGNNPSETIGSIISTIDPLLEKISPDCVLVLGDTNSCLSVIPAKKRKIPIFHMEAGNRCFDQRVPEEINRKIIDHTADINMPYSSIAREYLLKEGFPADRIIKTGSPMYEVLNHYLSEIKASTVVSDMGLKRGQYFLVSCHREENVDSDINLKKFYDLIEHIVSYFELPVVISTHPRTRNRLEKAGYSFSKLVRLTEPLGFFDYNKLQVDSKCVLSDSGTISEEASILDFPALNIREAHERPEAMEEGCVMMVGLEVDRAMQGIDLLASHDKTTRVSLEPVDDYSSEFLSEKVVRILHSYTDYVNRVVWRKL